MSHRPLVIVPTYNERENLAAFVAAVLAALPAAELLIVDDASPDGTGELAEALMRREPRLHLLRRRAKEGLGRAYIAGFRWALGRTYDRVLQMDADFSHNPADLPRLLAATDRADVAIGSRYCGGIRVRNWPLRRLLLSYGAGIYVRLLTRLPVMDPTGGFKCFRREVLAALPLARLSAKGYGFQIETSYAAWRMGFSLEEVPIVFADRKAGASKMSLAITCEALGLVWRLAFRRAAYRRPACRA